MFLLFLPESQIFRRRSRERKLLICSLFVQTGGYFLLIQIDIALIPYVSSPLCGTVKHCGNACPTKKVSKYRQKIYVVGLWDKFAQYPYMLLHHVFSYISIYFLYVCGGNVPQSHTLIISPIYRRFFVGFMSQKSHFLSLNLSLTVIILRIHRFQNNLNREAS